MTARDRKRLQRLRESNGEAFFGFRFDAVALEDLLIAAGHLREWDVASKGAITAALAAYLGDRVTSVTDVSCSAVATCAAINSNMVMTAMMDTPTAPAEIMPEVELVASRDSDGAYRYELRLRPAASDRAPYAFATEPSAHSGGGKED